ncbi:MAG: alpha/beta fold hydrolase [Lachnospiraceae bacterium]|nr:alpha/beta fold hydrolase [Lachnospiraceae bacterium]
MKPEIVTYLSRDEETTIYAEKYVPEKEVKGILIIAHGMNEHIGRYKELCEFFASEGYLVAGPDHLGHGHTAKDYQGEFGYFAENDGATVLVRDVHRLKKMIEEEYPGKPVFLLGHSMGSFIARNYMEMYGSGIRGVIIMGTGSFNSFITRLELLYIRFSALFGGWHKRDSFCTRVSLGHFADLFPEDGPMGWVCSRKEAVEEVAGDPLGGREFTLNGYYWLTVLILRMQDKALMSKIPRSLPIFLMSGEEDPVGGNGAAIRGLYRQYKAMGFSDVTSKLYPGDRHELFHEKDRYNVFFDIMDFMKKHS